MKLIAATVIALLSLPAIGQGSYKCATPSGSVYQDRPCTSQKSTLRVYEAADYATPTAAPAEGNTREKAFLAERTKDRKRSEITDVEREIADLQQAMNNELEVLRQKKSLAKNNLAGATWEASISGEMQAVTSKYEAQIKAKQEKIRQMRDDLAKL